MPLENVHHLRVRYGHGRNGLVYVDDHRLPVFVDVDRLGGGDFRQAGHGHDVAGEHDHEAGPGRNHHVAQAARRSSWAGPTRPGSVESEYCVFAMQIGRWPKPAS